MDRAALDKMAGAPVALPRTKTVEVTEFSLDRTENPHPRMLEHALMARAAAHEEQGNQETASRLYWQGYLAAMCDATGERPEDLNAWLDRAIDG